MMLVKLALRRHQPNSTPSPNRYKLLEPEDRRMPKECENDWHSNEATRRRYEVVEVRW